MPIHNFASLLHSTTTSNTSPLKVRVEYSCGSVEYTTACSTLIVFFNRSAKERVWKKVFGTGDARGYALDSTYAE